MHTGALLCILGRMSTNEHKDNPLEIYTRDECVEILRSSLSTVGALIRDGKLYSFRVGRGYRVPRAALEAFQRGEEYNPAADPMTAPSMETWPPTEALELGE